MERFYAEDGIDRLIREKFFPSRSYKGVFVEVGAGDPARRSMSRHFRESGWRVVAVEPNPHLCRRHRAEGLGVVECAAGGEDRDGAEFRLTGPAEGGGARAEAVAVPVRRLDTILREQLPGAGRVDVVSVDVDGQELEVLGGFSLERYRPRVVVLENCFDDARYQYHMHLSGYRLWTCIWPNQLYVPAALHDRVYRLARRFAGRVIRLPRRVASRLLRSL